jgi:hypothetical protein
MGLISLINYSKLRNEADNLTALRGFLLRVQCICGGVLLCEQYAAATCDKPLPREFKASILAIVLERPLSIPCISHQLFF